MTAGQRAMAVAMVYPIALRGIYFRKGDKSISSKETGKIPHSSLSRARSVLANAPAVRGGNWRRASQYISPWPEVCPCTPSSKTDNIANRWRDHQPTVTPKATL